MVRIVPLTVKGMHGYNRKVVETAHMFVSIINDCHDGNAMGKQVTRAARLFPNASMATVGIEQDELEAAGNLIDILDASDGDYGVILVNVAPRQGRGKKWPNGTPFGYFSYKKTLIVSTIAEMSLSLVKKLGLADSLQLTDVPTVIDAMIERGYLEKHLRNLIVKSQFRSYDYMPRLAKWVMDGVEVPSEPYSFTQVATAPKAIWWVDNFGNCKTTILPEEVGHEPGKVLMTKVGEVKCFERLKDIPNDEVGLIIGSSGIGLKRFLELNIQGKSAAAKFNLKPGTELF